MLLAVVIKSFGDFLIYLLSLLSVFVFEALVFITVCMVPRSWNCIKRGYLSATLSYFRASLYWNSLPASTAATPKREYLA